MTFIFFDRQPIGYAWLAPVTGNHAFGHFCFFKDVWGDNTVDAGEIVLSYWFNFPGHSGPLLDVIIGIVPTFNKRAQAYVQRIGFTELGVIPGMFKDKFGEREDAFICYRSREDDG